MNTPDITETATDSPKRSTMGTRIVAGLVGMAALGAGAFVVPAVAGAQTTPEPDVVTLDQAQPEDGQSDRSEQRAERLQGLVDNGTITQEQADQIAEQIADGDSGRRGKRGHHRGTGKSDVVTDLLGLTADELRTELRAGNSLADVAEANGVDAETLTQTLVDALNAHIDEKVADGSLTADEADAKRAEIAERVEDKINRVKSEDGRRGHRHGPKSNAETNAPA